MLSVLVLVACNPIKGKLTVVSPLEINTGKISVINVGKYDASIDFSSERKAVFAIKEGKKTHKIRISLPEGERFPENGTFAIQGEYINQAWDLVGTINTDILHSDEYREREHCSYQEAVQYCWHQDGETVCGIRWETRWGYMNVEFYYLTEVKKIVINFDSHLAMFDSVRKLIQKVYTYKGRCF